MVAAQAPRWSARLAVGTALALAALGLATPTAAQPGDDGAAPAQLMIKRHKVLIPPPLGMTSVMGQDWLLDEIVQATTSKPYYLEAVFIPTFVWDAYQERHTDDSFLADFAVVQTSKKLSFDDQENCDSFYRLRHALNESFRLQIESMTTPLREVMDASSDADARSAAANVSIDDGRMVPVGIVRNDDEAFISVCATRFSATIDGQKKSWMMVAGMSMVILNDRVVYLYKYKRGAPDPNRVAAIRRSLAIWTNAVLNANGSQRE